MTTIALLHQGWADSVNQVRNPYWLDKSERSTLAETIITLMETVTLFPSVRDQLDAVLTELGVAEARDHVWPTKTEIARRANEYSADDLPIRMSEEELSSVLSLATLPVALRERLTGVIRKK